MEKIIRLRTHEFVLNLTVIARSKQNSPALSSREQIFIKLQCRVGVVIDTHPSFSTNFLERPVILTLRSPFKTMQR